MCWLSWRRLYNMYLSIIMYTWDTALIIVQICREEAILLLSITYVFASSVYFIKSKFTTN